LRTIYIILPIILYIFPISYFLQILDGPKKHVPTFSAGRGLQLEEREFVHRHSNVSPACEHKLLESEVGNSVEDAPRADEDRYLYFLIA